MDSFPPGCRARICSFVPHNCVLPSSRYERKVRQLLAMGRRPRSREGKEYKYSCRVRVPRRPCHFTPIASIKPTIRKRRTSTDDGDSSRTACAGRADEPIAAAPQVRPRERDISRPYARRPRLSSHADEMQSTGRIWSRSTCPSSINPTASRRSHANSRTPSTTSDFSTSPTSASPRSKSTANSPLAKSSSPSRRRRR